MSRKNKQTYICPKCKKETEIVKTGFAASGTQRYICDKCGKTYTINAKKKRFSDYEKYMALNMLYSGEKISDIRRKFGCGRSTIYKWKDEFIKSNRIIKINSKL